MGSWGLGTNFLHQNILKFSKVQAFFQKCAFLKKKYFHFHAGPLSEVPLEAVPCTKGVGRKSSKGGGQ